MPRGDRTGPWGLGPRTGRAAGYCSGYPVPGYMNPTPGFGRGFGKHQTKGGAGEKDTNRTVCQRHNLLQRPDDLPVYKEALPNRGRVKKTFRDRD